MPTMVQILKEKERELRAGGPGSGRHSEGGKSKPDFNNRQRFNWGYHDGAHHENQGGSIDRNKLGTKMDSTHFDQVYVHGFKMGFNDSKNGNYDHSTHGTTTSDDAWKRSGLKDGNTYRPNALVGKDSSGKKIAPWMPQDRHGL